MSTYTSARTRLIARTATKACTMLLAPEDAVEPIRGAACDIRPALEGIDVAPDDLTSDSDDLQVVIDRLPDSSHEFLTRRNEQWAQAVSIVQGDSEIGHETAPLSRDDALAVVREELGSAGGDIERANRDVIVGEVCAALHSSDIDFSTTAPAAVGDALIIDGRRGHSAVRVRVDATGAVEEEWMTGPGDDCGPLHAAFQSAMADRGVLLSVEFEDRHDGKRDGARLMRPASPSQQQKRDFASLKSCTVDEDHPTTTAEATS